MKTALKPSKPITLPPINLVADNERVLSIYITYRGFAFTVFENATLVVDWGHCYVKKQDQAHFLERIAKFIERNQIDTVLSFSEEGRPESFRTIIRSLENFCNEHNTDFQVLSKDKISTVFKEFGTYTKYQRAGLVAAYLPNLAYKLPPKRKVWQSEDLRMAIFDSACLALAYFYSKQG